MELAVAAEGPAANGHCLSYYSETLENNRLTILAPKSVLTSINSNAFYAAHTYKCDLYIHKSWSDNCSGDVWTYKNSDNTESTSREFRSIHFVDDNGNEVQ